MKKIKIKKSAPKVQKSSFEQETIVEYSFNSKSSCFVVRFLDGSSFVLNTLDLPKKVQFNKRLNWEGTQLTPEKKGLFVPLFIQNGGINIECNIIRAKGKLL